MKKYFPNKIIFSSFLIWRIALFGVAFLAVFLLPVFGNRFPYANRVLEPTGLPTWVWGFGNFDGVHYLRLAQNGYQDEYSQAFFPLYPLLTRFVANFLPKDPLLDTRTFTDPAFFWSGFLLANLFFLVLLFVFYKFLRLDFNQKVSFRTLFLLLAFPTSFYLGAVYTESLFLLLTVLALYSMRKKKFLLAGAFIALAGATRILGILLIPVYLLEVFKTKNLDRQSVLGLLVSPLGLISYMYFLSKNFGNAFYFLTSQPAFGAQRSAVPVVLLPQVVFRYAKIFLSVNTFSLTFFNAFLEFSFTLVPLVFLVLVYRKMRFSYWLFSLTALLLPTLTGTFSSMPRYALVAFLVLPFLTKLENRLYWLTLGFFIVLNAILAILFTRGYWVA
jgi:Gpi18-like mannosyltransferase